MGSAGTPFSKIKLFYKQSVNRHPHLLVSVAAASLLCALNFQPSAWTMHVSFFGAWRNGIFKIVQDMKKNEPWSYSQISMWNLKALWYHHGKTILKATL